MPTTIADPLEKQQELTRYWWKRSIDLEDRLELALAALREIKANAAGFHETQTEMHPAHRALFKMVAERARAELARAAS